MVNRSRKTQATHRDGEAPRVVAQFREELPTKFLAVPRRKRYFTPLDLDAVAPPDAEVNAPRRVLDL
jgi:hypothetical protein